MGGAGSAAAVHGDCDRPMCRFHNVLPVAGMHRDKHVVGLDIELGAFHSQGVVRETQREALAGVALVGTPRCHALYSFAPVPFVGRR